MISLKTIRKRVVIYHGDQSKVNFLNICLHWLLEVGHFSFANGFLLLTSFMYMCVWCV